MFNLSWSEIFIILIAALIFIGPDELPSVIRTVREFIRKIRNLGSELASSLNEFEQQSNLRDEAEQLNSDIRTIIDLDGNPQETYDISDIIEELKTEKSTESTKNNSNFSQK